MTQLYQHLYLGFLYGVLAIKTSFMDDFTALASGRTGTVDIAPLTRDERVVFWAGKAVFATWFLVLPITCSGLSWARLLLLWLWSEAVAGWVLAFMFQVCAVIGVAGVRTADHRFPCALTSFRSQLSPPSFLIVYVFIYLPSVFILIFSHLVQLLTIPLSFLFVSSAYRRHVNNMM